MQMIHNQSYQYRNSTHLNTIDDDGSNNYSQYQMPQTPINPNLINSPHYDWKYKPYTRPQINEDSEEEDGISDQII